MEGGITVQNAERRCPGSVLTRRQFSIQTVRFRYPEKATQSSWGKSRYPAVRDSLEKAFCVSSASSQRSMSQKNANSRQPNRKNRIGQIRLTASCAR